MSKIIKCKACGADVSKNAPTCPKCGEPQKRKAVGFGTYVVAGVIAIFVGVGVRDAITPKASGSSSYRPAVAAKKAPPVNIPGSQWHYRQSEDGMSGGRTSHAIVSSSNTVSFDFPYQGAQHGNLTLRTHPRYGKSIIFQIEKGQVLCNSYVSDQ